MPPLQGHLSFQLLSKKLKALGQTSYLYSTLKGCKNAVCDS